MVFRGYTVMVLKHKTVETHQLREPFGSCLLNSTANRLTRFFSYFQHIFKHYLNKNPQTTNALTFLTHTISAKGGVT